MADAAVPIRSGARSWTQALAVYRERRTLVMLALGFAAGLPFLLVFDTLSAWLRQAGLSLDVIAFFSLATLAYAFKFLWAPVVDRTEIPGLTRLLGHRRSWMLVVQALIIAGLLLISMTDPAGGIGLMATFAVLTGFASATQDIVIDAWRIEVAPENEQGAMAAAYQWGYRIAFITAGAAPLFLADAFSWSISYGVMASLMIIGVLAVLLAPRERAHAVRPIPRTDGPPRPVMDRLEWALRLAVLVGGAIILGTGLSAKATFLASLMPADLSAAFLKLWTARPLGLLAQLIAIIAGFAVIVLAAWPLPGKPTQPGLFLSHAFGAPIADFLKRFGSTAGLIVFLICFYRISDFVLNIMNPFYLDLGFTLTEVAQVRKIFGAVMFMLGVFAGGYAIARWGLMKPLVVGAILAPVSNLAFAWLSTVGPSIPGLMIALGFNNIAQSFAGTCLIAYMSSLTSAGFTASQYALFSSLYALPDKFIMTQSGRIVESVAQSVEDGGLFAPLKAFFAGLPEVSFNAGAVKAGIAPASLGAGYFAFFIYTFLIGMIVVPAAFAVARRNQAAASGK
jgi:PAT family beta-lactamase induction signal transducer AmpG